MPIKFLVSGGGYSGFWGGVPFFVLMGARIFLSKTKGPGEKVATRNHPEISSQKLADFNLECRSPYDSYVRDRPPLWPF